MSLIKQTAVRRTDSGQITLAALSLFFYVVAIVLFTLAAIFAFGWFGSDADIRNVFGLIALGSAFFAAGHLV